MGVESMTQALCDLALRFGEGDDEFMPRPFGIFFLLMVMTKMVPACTILIIQGQYGNVKAKLLDLAQKVLILLFKNITIMT